MHVRSREERASQARQRLAEEANVWVATASRGGAPHLVPLSLAWIDGDVVVSTPFDTPTVRNAAETGRARLALESAADVVVIDSDVRVVPLADADVVLVETYAGRVGWDPRAEPGEWAILVCTPRRMQGWNSVAEIVDRTVMRGGEWLG